MTRCYNCGGVGHLTQYCPHYGPKFPAPGKTAQDYGDQAQKIANLFARDIISEHEADHVDEGEVLSPKQHPPRDTQVSLLEKYRRQYTCGRCGAVPGTPCVTLNGRPTGSHNDRSHQYLKELNAAMGQ
jgi:hypothetical protein